MVPRDRDRPPLLIDPGQNPRDHFAPDDEVQVDEVREMFGNCRISFNVYRARPISKEEKTMITDLVMADMGIHRAKPQD